MISNSSFFNNFGTDSEDTFTLMDYFGKDDTQEYTLEKIFADFNFYEQIKLGNARNTKNIRFYYDEIKHSDIDIVICLIIDLATLFLESYHNKSINLEELDKVV